MHYYQHNIADYKADTAHLSLLEHGAYRQLLDWYYLDESPIPTETEVVFRRLCARTEEEKKAVCIVLAEFFSADSSGYSHRRCDAEISSYKAKADRARDNGKLGGRPKKTKEVISGNLEETHAKANHKPLTNNHNKTNMRRKASPAECELFAEFYSQYPRKEAKANAIKAWSKLTESEKQSALEAVKHYARSKSGSEMQYIAMPASWINGKRWEDQSKQSNPAKPSFLLGVI